MRIVVERVTPARASGAPEPITIGVPVPAGVCRDEQSIRLSTAGGDEVPLQVQVTGRWTDGSIKWALLDFQHQAAAPAQYAATWNADPRRTPNRPLRVETGDRMLRVDTGAAVFVLRSDTFPFCAVSSGGDEILTRSSLAVTAGGRVCETRLEQVAVETSGPLRVVVRVSGAIVRRRRRIATIVARVHFFAGLPVARVELTLCNPRRARHPGGFWELGDPASILLRDVSVRLDVAGAGPDRIAHSAEPGLPPQTCSTRLSIYQDSSGGSNWNSRNHVNRDGRVPNRFRGYQIDQDGVTHRRERATPLVAIERGGVWAATAMPYFWQNFPKAIDGGDGSLILRLWPEQYGDIHELQAGEQKTHAFYIGVGAGSCDLSALEWTRSPSRVIPDPLWSCAAGAVPWLSPAALALDENHARLVDAAITGPDSFERKRERIDEYGWRHFGDLHADHESVGRDGSTPLVSHYNNQYDAIAAFAYHFLRTGDGRWWRAMQELAAHVVDIDVYHTHEDKSAYSGGLFWHTCHYLDAGRSTHRSYPRSAQTNGGGPSNEHNYTTGLLLHYRLTGSEASREAVLGLARWVVNMDDGRRSIFRWIDRGFTGLASATGAPDYHGPGRGAANSILALLNAYEVDGCPEFLAKAESIIRRCIHPEDDIASRDLLDRERRWSYTVFLQALGRYLRVKGEARQTDTAFVYARESLLHYARWMAVHEFPYLDRPEMLEYPTETWAAQDARKSEVFDLAARHASGAERERFLERAEFFWRYAVRTLSAMPTRTLTRPVVLMAGHGFLRAQIASEGPGDAIAPGKTASFPPPMPFVPQKARVRTRLRVAAAAGSGTVTAGLLWWLLK